MCRVSYPQCEGEKLMDKCDKTMMQNANESAMRWQDGKSESDEGRKLVS